MSTQASRRDPAEQRPAFEKLGEYRIVREIGRGGMGLVFEAVQESLGRHVALKVLPFHGLLSPTQLERFRREARAAARLHHTNIVPVFGVGEEAGTPSTPCSSSRAKASTPSWTGSAACAAARKPRPAAPAA